MRWLFFAPGEWAGVNVGLLASHVFGHASEMTLRSEPTPADLSVGGQEWAALWSALLLRQRDPVST